MAGHSQFKNIMHRKGAQDAKRAKRFTKMIRELTVAAQASPDPDNNPRLRTAMIAARSANVPKETIERAIKRDSGSDNVTHYEAIRYEGYGPGGAALIVETLTDNRRRMAPEIRACFNKYGGGLGETNSVNFLFNHQGLIRYASTHSEDALLQVALESGAEDFDTTDLGYEITCSFEMFGPLRDQLIHKFGDPEEIQLRWVPQTSIPIEGKALESLEKLILALEENDDVQAVWTNAILEDKNFS